jgi:hypothetical protein
MTQDEAAQLTGMRIARGYGARPAPAKTADRVMLGLDRNVERELLKCLLAAPALARELPPEAADQSHAEGRALAAFTGIEGAGELTDSGIIELFRGSEHESLIERVQKELLDSSLEPADAEVVFRDALRKIEIARVEAEIRALTQKAREGLDTEADRSAITALLARRESLRRAGSGTSRVI